MFIYYFTDMYLFGDPLKRQTFKGSFIVSPWSSKEDFTLDLANNSTRESELQQILFDVYSRSDLRSCFVAADILALDKWVPSSTILASKQKVEINNKLWFHFALIYELIWYNLKQAAFSIHGHGKLLSIIYIMSYIIVLP